MGGSVEVVLGVDSCCRSKKGIAKVISSPAATVRISAVSVASWSREISTGPSHRKGLFIGLLMTDEAERSFLKIFEEEWHRALQDWIAVRRSCCSRR